MVSSTSSARMENVPGTENTRYTIKTVNHDSSKVAMSLKTINMYCEEFFFSQDSSVLHRFCILIQYRGFGVQQFLSTLLQRCHHSLSYEILNTWNKSVVEKICLPNMNKPQTTKCMQSITKHTTKHPYYQISWISIFGRLTRLTYFHHCPLQLLKIPFFNRFS